MEGLSDDVDPSHLNETPAISGQVSPNIDRRVKEGKAAEYVAKFATFAASDWMRYEEKGTTMYQGHDLSLTQEEFKKLSDTYLQFAERFVFIRGKSGNVQNPQRKGFLCCDDAFAHGDNF